MTKCVICECRPSHNGDGYCHDCTSRMDAQKQRAKTRQPQKYLTYRGIVVGLVTNGKGKLSPRLLKRSPDYLPKRATIDLNTYIEGFSRAEIKRFKACVLTLAHA